MIALQTRLSLRPAIKLASSMTPQALEPALIKAMRKALQPVARQVRARAPVGKTRGLHLAGRLQRSIGIKVVRGRRGGIWAGIRGEFYGRLVETGHRVASGGRLRGRIQGRVTGNVPPHPFVQPTVEANFDQIQRTLNDEVAKELEFQARLARAVR